MTSARLIITGKNSALPNDAAQSCEGRIGSRYVVCPDCGGDGWVHGWGNNPSDKPFEATCRYCGGEGAILRTNKVGAHSPARGTAARSVALPDVERAAPVYDLTAGRWIVLPSGTPPDAAVLSETGRSATTKYTPLSTPLQRPAVPPVSSAGRLETVMECLTMFLGLTTIGVVAGFFLVLAQ